MSNESDNIQRTPTWPLIRDGLESTAMIIESLPSIDKDGEEIVTLILKVDDFIKKKYGLKPKVDYDEQNRWKRIFKEIDLYCANPHDTSNQVWRYDFSFINQPTLASKRFENLKTIISIKNKRILLLEADNLRLNEQIMLFRTNPAMAVAQGTEVFEKAAKAVADLIRPQQKEMQ